MTSHAHTSLTRLALSRARAARGFTLIELLVVILVIAILLAVAAPSFLRQQDKAHDSSAMQAVALGYRVAQTVAASQEGRYVASDVDALVTEMNRSEPGRFVASTVPTDGTITDTVYVSVPAGGDGATDLLVQARSRSGRVCLREVLQRVPGPVHCLDPVDGTASGGDGGGGTGTTADADLHFALSASDYRGPATMAVSGGAQTRLAPDGYFDGADLAYTEDGAQMAFRRNHQGACSDDGMGMITCTNQTDIWVRDTATGTETRITNTESDSEGAPALSGDGSEIVFARAGQLVVAPTTGTGSERILPGTSGVYLYEPPSWGGGTVAFVRSVGDEMMGPTQLDVFVVPADGSAAATNLTNTDGRDETQPDVSSGGGKVVYRVSGGGGALNGLAAQPTTGGTPTVLLDEGGGSTARAPDYSPDGSEVVYHRSLCVEDTATATSTCQDDLYRLPATGGTETRITATESQSESSPEW